MAKKTGLSNPEGLPKLDEAIQSSLNQAKVDWSKIKIDTPNLSPPRYEPFIPKVNPDVTKNIKLLSQSILEAIEPVQIELARVTSELVKSNERVELAEQKADRAESKADKLNSKMYWTTLLAFLIPFSFSVLQYVQTRREEGNSKELSVTVERLARKVQVLQYDLSIAKKKQAVVKVQPNGIVLKSLPHSSRR